MHISIHDDNSYIKNPELKQIQYAATFITAIWTKITQ